MDVSLSHSVYQGKAVDGYQDYPNVEGKRSNGEIANYPGDSNGGRSRELLKQSGADGYI